MYIFFTLNIRPILNFINRIGNVYYSLILLEIATLRKATLLLLDMYCGPNDENLEFSLFHNTTFNMAFNIFINL